MEENRRFSWADLFIKIIIVTIFILFTVWLLSLSTKGLSNSLDVLTNNIFSQNIERMKNVGKEYFTLERLPEKVGDIKTLTLEDMYEKNLILELTDKNGNSCSAENSYVSVEKYENEYQMKVYLECGEESDYIIVIMGCYDYCKNDICEFDPEEEKEIEYEYKKTNGGSWTEYGKWSEWSKVSVSKTDYRQVETKVETEKYSYDKTITEEVYEKIEASCPSGYKKTSDGTKCYKVNTVDDYLDPVCETISGYKLVGRKGFTCTYSKNVTSTTTDIATCPSGYTKSGNSCVKSSTSTTTDTAICPSGYTKSGNSCVKTGKSTKDPVCETKPGYTLTGRNGFTCNYVKTTNETKNPTCPVKDGYIVTRDGFTCTYTKYIKGDYVTTKKGEYVPGNTSQYIYQEVGTAEYVYDCNKGCAFRWIHTYKVYKAKLETLTETATCPSGYTKSGSTCVKSSTSTKTAIAVCPSGYTKSGNSCVKPVNSTKNPVCPTKDGYTLTGREDFTCTYSKTTTDKKNPVCPTKDGYTLTEREGFTCTYSKTTTKSITADAVCKADYTKSGNSCLKVTTNTLYEDLIKSCPAGYKETSDGSKCYKKVESTVTVTEDKKVTYYRYRVREYIGGTTDYKWSTSKSDKKLLDAGYKLTGRTR